MSNRQLAKVGILPSVTELVDRIVADMLQGRPENWRSLIRPEGNGNLVPCVSLSDMWEGDISADGVFPFRGDQLKPDKADGKGTHKYFETILDIEYASEVAVKFSADPGWRIHGKQPNVNASGNLERIAKGVPLLRSKKRIV